MSLPRILSIVLGVAIILFGIYEMAVAGNMTAFVFVTGGIVIAALGAGILGKSQSKEDCEE